MNSWLPLTLAGLLYLWGAVGAWREGDWVWVVGLTCYAVANFAFAAGRWGSMVR